MRNDMPEKFALGGKRRMKISTIIFSVINFIGVIFYVSVVCGIVHQAKMEQRDYYDAGDSISFLANAGPVLLACFILNVSWGIKGLVDIVWRRNYQALLALTGVAVMWVGFFEIMRFFI